MKPLQWMKPRDLVKTETWWPTEFGTPSTSGSAPDLRYAYFPERRRLVIERAGKLTAFDIAKYQFRGVLQVSPRDSTLSFLTQHGRIEVASLNELPVNTETVTNTPPP
jgi:hypothetical protein